MSDKAYDGKQALDAVIKNVERNRPIKHCNYELILLDCNMPIMDGYTATLKIRQYLYEQGIKQPIIVAVTGHTEDEYVKRAIASGMNQVLSKPVSVPILKVILKDLNYEHEPEKPRVID